MFPCLRFFFNKVWVRIRSAWINCWMALRSSWQEPPGIERLAARWVVKLNVAWSVWLFLWGLKRMVRFCELEKRFVAEESWSLLLNVFSSTLVLAYKMIMHISQVQQHLKGGLVYISLCLTKGVDQLSTFCRFFFRNPLLSSGDVWFLRASSSSTTKSKWFRSRGAAYRSRAAAVETFPGWFGTRFLLRIQNPWYFQIIARSEFRYKFQDLYGSGRND